MVSIQCRLVNSFCKHLPIICLYYAAVIYLFANSRLYFLHDLHAGQLCSPFYELLLPQSKRILCDHGHNYILPHVNVRTERF